MSFALKCAKPLQLDEIQPLNINALRFEACETPSPKNPRKIHHQIHLQKQEYTELP